MTCISTLQVPRLHQYARKPYRPTWETSTSFRAGVQQRLTGIPPRMLGLPSLLPLIDELLVAVARRINGSHIETLSDAIRAQCCCGKNCRNVTRRQPTTRVAELLAGTDRQNAFQALSWRHAGKIGELRAFARASPHRMTAIARW